MANYELTYKLFGERAILIEWPSKISSDILDDIRCFDAIILETLVNLEETIPAYNSLTLLFNDIIKFDVLIGHLKTLYTKRNSVSISNSKYLWELPVCYHLRYGLDLQELSTKKALSKNEIISLHTKQVYEVCFIGFLPGFLYLGGLDQLLQMPRKETPNLNIVKGAVAIGGQQTGIYPEASPGGWYVIGNCPIPLFDVSKDPPCHIKSGDKVTFNPISLQDYELKNYHVKKTLFND